MARGTSPGSWLPWLGLSLAVLIADQFTKVLIVGYYHLGESRYITSFFDIVSYGTLAENVSESLQRGSRIMVTGRLEQRSWETQEGEKRSKVEVIADEIGPSLRWATAQITRNERRGGGDFGGGGDGGGRGGGGGGGAAPGGGGGGNAPAPSYDDFGEEPF